MRTRLIGLFVLATVLVTIAAATAVPAAAAQRSDCQKAILRLIAAERAAHGLAAVHTDAALGRAALGHARDMVRREYFSHTSPAGASCGDRARRAGYRRTGYRSWAVSEVIAWGMSTGGSPEEVFAGWMHSPYHRSVILGGRWRDVGVACVEGTFGGVPGSFMYVVDFGRRVR